MERVNHFANELKECINLAQIGFVFYSFHRSDAVDSKTGDKNSCCKVLYYIWKVFAWKPIRIQHLGSRERERAKKALKK